MKIQMSDRTKKLKVLKIIFSLLHFIAIFGPFLYFIPYAFITGETTEKLGLSITLVVSIVMAIISLIISESHRQGLYKTIMWVMIIGVLICLKKIETFIFVMAALSILDELVFVKLYDYFKTTYRTNREIDRRQ